MASRDIARTVGTTPEEAPADLFEDTSSRGVQQSGTAPASSVSQNTEGQDFGAFDRLESFLGSPVRRKLEFTLKLLFFLIIISLLVVQQLQFKNTWSRECDYNIKIWSTVWISRSLFQHVVVLVIMSLVLLNKHLTVVFALRHLQTVIFFFKLCWFSYGIKPVLVDSRCDSVSGAWGLVLWWLEFSLTVVPCVCLCILCLVGVYVFCNEIPDSSDLPQPTPEDIRKKLKVVKFAEISSELRAQQSETRVSQQIPPSNNQSGSEEGGVLSDMASTLTGVPLPDFRRIQSGLLGRQPSGLQLATQQHTRFATMQPIASVVGNQLQRQASSSTAPTCPICFCQFEKKENVVQLPCDFRHVFHDECLFPWLEQSQACPCCRVNLVEALRCQEDQKRTEEEQSEGCGCCRGPVVLEVFGCQEDRKRTGEENHCSIDQQQTSPDSTEVTNTSPKLEDDSIV